MLVFNNWELKTDGQILARQYDHLSRTLLVSGVPEGWDWQMLVQAGDNFDVIELSPMEDGVGVVLTAQQLAVAGSCKLQLLGTLRADGVTKRHTNTLSVYIPESLSGDANWPQVPSAFSQMEERVRAMAAQAGESAASASASAAQSRQNADSVDADQLNARIDAKGDNLEFDEAEGLLYLTSGGERIGDGIRVATSGGGGGGESNNAVLSLTNTTGWIYKSIAWGAACPISVSWSSLENDLATGSGVLQVIVAGSLKHTAQVEQGALIVDVGPWLPVGSSTLRIKVTDVYGNSRSLNFNLTALQLTLESSFDASAAYSGAITYPYVPTGAAPKTVHFRLDGTELDTATVTASGRQQTMTIPAQSHGSHSFEVWFSAEVDGETVESNHLYYDLICIEEGNTTPIISTRFRQTTAEQFDSIAIPYIVYDPSGLTAAVTLKAGAETVASLTVDRTEQVWTYRADEAGDLTLSITCGSAVKRISLTVTESTMGAAAETDSLALYLSGYGRSNNEENPAVWRSGSVSAALTGFNWTSDGWKNDDDGITALRVAGDARVSIPLHIFAQDFRTTGKTIEVEFAARDVLDYDATVISCWSGDRGLKITPQRALLKSEQSEISTQYREDEHVRLSFVVQKRSEYRLLLVYINGILSGAAQYPVDDDFSQSVPVGITIGSSDCTTDVYCIRVYDNDLTRFQILDNWISDTQVGLTKKQRYDRNKVFDDYGRIVMDQLPADLPYLILEAAELPRYKGDKKTVSGRYVDPAVTERSFTFNGAQIDVQGTSSQYYARKNYKIKFKGGFTQNGTTHSGYQLRDGSVPTDTFTFKADVASSEGANNVELVRLYNDACPYRTPPQEADSAVRQGIDGFPIVVFQDAGGGPEFIGKYNFNNDKGTPEVFGFADGDERWEILNNTSDRVLWKSDDFSGTDWQNDFEARYPEGNTDAAALAALASWLKSTDQSAATGDALPEAVTYDGAVYTADTAAYRLAKFRAELADHMELQSTLFYYLFTELFLMVDSRAKNAFPSMLGGDKWCWLPYDMDTAMGTNNEGALVFGYELEDTDQTGAADVFNGQESVLWVNLRQAFPDELRTMYQALRSQGKLSYADTEARFEAHQAKWPEAIFNEDSFYKYLQPLTDDGSGAYLGMLQGSKAEQRKWWLYNRFRYLDSKYNAGDALSDVITLRGYAKSDITVTPYADIYASVKYGSYLVQARALRGGSYELVCPLDNVNDTEIYIYSASQIKDVGDLSGLKVGYADFSFAAKLQSLKLGDSADAYSNPNLTELYLGGNVLMKTLDVRNCPNLTQAVDLSGCTGLESVYFDGTAITGCALPNGGVIRTLHLPATVTNLTIRNQTGITDFQLPGYDHITTLRLENVSDAVPARDILETIPENSRVRLLGFDWSFDDAADILTLCDRLDTMRGLDEQGGNADTAQVSGTVRVENITGAQLADIQSRYPGISVVYQHITSSLCFYDDTGTTLLYTAVVADGGDAEYGGTTPAKSSTAQYSYTFAGWSRTPGGGADSTALTAVTADRSVYAAFTATVRTYTVRFYNGSTLLQTVSGVAYGGSASYTGDTPVDEENGQEFLGWEPSPVNIIGNTSCYAQFKALWEWIDPPVDVSGAYAVQWNYDDSSTKLARGGLASGFGTPAPAAALSVAGSSPFDSLLPWSGMKRYNIIDGEVACSEDDAGFSMTDHDTVVHIPEFYYYAYKDTDNHRWTWAISPTEKAGFSRHPGSGRYIGRYHTSGDSTAVFSRSGVVPLVNTSKADFRTYSHAKGDKWWMLDLATWSALQLLYLVEFADFHSQSKLGYGYGSSSQVSGATDEAVYHTVNGGNTCNQYRWIEQPFGRCRNWIDGFLSASRKCYAGTDNAAFTDNTSSLTATGVNLPSTGYITGFGFSEAFPWAFLPDDASGGSSSTFVPDSVVSTIGTRSAVVGGHYAESTDNGFWYFYLPDTATYTASYIGSRLLYIP